MSVNIFQNRAEERETPPNANLTHRCVCFLSRVNAECVQDVNYTHPPSDRLLSTATWQHLNTPQHPVGGGYNGEGRTNTEEIKNNAYFFSVIKS